MHWLPRKLVFDVAPRKGDATGRFQIVDSANGTGANLVDSYGIILLIQNFVDAINYASMRFPE